MHVWLVDAFADEEYQGNPAGVIVVPAGFPSARRMQAISHDLGLPTTAFVIPVLGTTYRIRWFTPEKELNICGHATIASACYLYDVAKIADSAPLEFQTQNGSLYTHRRDNRIAINLPRVDVFPYVPPREMEEALGVRIVYCGRAVDDIVIEVESARVVAEATPDFAKLAGVDCRGHVLTARGENGVDFVSRSFFPALGVNEDQVCVSAHCKLGPYWQKRLGRNRMTAIQLSPRGGRLFVEVTGRRVQVAGTARVARTLDAV
jgi:PhzF family phenazine biosynthesis protein